MSSVKPSPTISDYNRPFYEYASKHELRLQKCNDCGEFWSPPGPVCVNCLSTDYTWSQVSGKGTLASWVIFHKVYYPEFGDEIPYNVGLVELAEGPRLLTNIIGTPSSSLARGTPLTVIFEDRPDCTVPQFTLA